MKFGLTFFLFLLTSTSFADEYTRQLDQALSKMVQENAIDENGARKLRIKSEIHKLAVTRAPASVESFDLRGTNLRQEQLKLIQQDMRIMVPKKRH
jgi:hypothetical protein